jgi:glycine/D-amino acid oxidase-like deaminating enzyme
MKLRSIEPYWILKNGLIHSYPSLRKNITCDILIIGGGITGALMAYQLSKEGFATVIIDRRDIAMGSTSATTAMIQYEIDEPLYSLINKVGENTAVDSYREGVLAIDKLEEIVKAVGANCGFARKRSLYIADSRNNLSWLEEEYSSRKKYQFDVFWLNQAQLKQQFGIVGEGAILSNAGASLDPYCLTHALLKYCSEHHGAYVFDHTTAETIENAHPGKVVITENKNTIHCKKIVYASGYEAQECLKSKIVKLHSTYAFVSEPLANIPAAIRNTIFWNTQDPYLYFRSTKDNRILVGGGDESFKNGARRDRLIEKKEAFLLKSIQGIIPSLDVIPDFAWAGTFGVTKDALPYIGPHPDYPDSYFVLGFGGNGITFSVMGMRIISDALSGRHNAFLDYYRFNR